MTACQALTAFRARFLLDVTYRLEDDASNRGKGKGDLGFQWKVCAPVSFDLYTNSAKQDFLPYCGCT